ncbi:AAA family ATPase [Pseudocolwellia agarivorans]|uniref:AAA family ATPase n=1 Tax=Pseudocolwellia agarivorans TaxID=1911682 RepID=UPI000984D432|nr:AAA family ATPase [Pseudocolwellia agarivorans]
MYTAYFGLKEKPFSIAPDPQYLFMSDRHREALAHLTYGLGDAGGFVLLTGEVGTGKTTVSRCLMERLPENTQAAFILNPTLSSHELLATICDELKIRYRKTGATLKTLTDKIQEKLLKNHKENTNTLLIIDEAQHLQPEVLEQLRLLTNLETNTKKLLQVILIGQPELQTLLKRRDLRQLAQRITARYHLLPLNKQEVAQYIKHRLSIAEGIRALFSVSAMNTIHKICGGIPRLINLVCERSLINAYSSNTAVVNKRIVLLSAHEALGDDYEVTPWWKKPATKIALVVLLIGIISAGAYFFGSYQTQNNTLKPLAIIDASEKNLNDIKPSKQTEITSEEIQNDEITNSIVDKKTNEVLPVDASAQQKQEEVESPITEKESTPAPKEIVQQAPAKAKQVKQEVQAKDIEFTQVEGVSDELLSQFKKALNNEDDTNDTIENINNEDARNQEIDPIEKMPLWVQNGIPQLQFEQHIYASDGQGWVKVNGRDRYEGDTIARELILVEILPQKVVLNFRGEKFTMPALSSW